MSEASPRGRDDTSDSEPNRRPRRQLRVRMSRLLPRSIRGVLVLLLLALLLPEVFIGAVHYYSLFQERRAQEFQVNLELARSVGSTFDAYFGAILRQELAIGAGFVSPQALTIEQMNQILATNARESPAIDHFGWTNPQGRVVASSEPQMIGLDSSDSPFFRQIIAGREWVVSDLLPGRTDIGPVFLIARRIHDERGNLQGVIVATVDAQRLDEVLRVERAGEAAIVIIDHRGWGVYRYPEIELTWEQRNWVEVNPIISRALSGEEIDDVILGSQQERRMASYTPIRSIGWVASASRTEDEVMAPVYGELFTEGTQRLVVILVALLIASAIGRIITVPVRRLRDYALAIGRGELDRRVEVSGPTELEDLASAFNRMAGELRTHQQEREDFVHTISHDLRNPLTIIHGRAQLLRRALEKEGLTGAELAGANAILTSAQRMNAMIQDLVDSARLEAGELRLDKRPVNLRSFLSELLERATGVMDVGRVKVEVPPGLPPVLADPDRLERILINLLSNALKYSPADTEVLVRASRGDGDVSVSVTDRGVGIAPEDQAHLFERFYRAREVRQTGGLGLGLYITKMLVEAHGGRIWVESRVPSGRGKGSTFFFTLSVARAEE